MSGGGYDYGRAGIIGIGTPQANPTVEAELRILLPPAIGMAVARLTSKGATPLIRLRDYMEGLEATLEQYDTLRPAAFGFACTGSSYLTEPDRELRLIERLEARFGYPVVTATAAIDGMLRSMGARRIALASPYTPELAEVAALYWRQAGYEIVEIRRIDTGSADTRSIYGLGSADARPAAEQLSALDVDAVLLSGTGMPSLSLIAGPRDGPPLLSSNLCLAHRLCALIGQPAPDPADWRARLAAALSPSDPEGTH